jgi:hypothetical protein
MEEGTSNQSNSSSSSSDEENYVFKAKICKRLSRELKLPELDFDVMGTYDPPSEHGLINSNVIIPSYYKLHEDPSKIFNKNYYDMIKDDIRNYRTLNEYQLKYIKDLDHEDKNELFDIFNECIKVVGEWMSDNS